GCPEISAWWQSPSFSQVRLRQFGHCCVPLYRRDPAFGSPKEEMDVNRVKTWVLIAALGGLFVIVGGLVLGGAKGLFIGLLFGLGFNLAMYWFSDKIAVTTTRSKPVTEQEYPKLYE